MENEYKWANNNPNVLWGTKFDEQGHHSKLIGGFFAGNRNHYLVAQVHSKNERGKNVIEFFKIGGSTFENDEVLKEEIEFVIEILDRGASVMNKRVRTNQSSEVCESAHNLTGTITDYTEERVVKRNDVGDPVRTGELTRLYFVKFDKINSSGCKGLWLQEKHFDFDQPEN